MKSGYKSLAVLGSTGSIGKNTLETVRNLNKNGFPVKVKYLSANSNYKLLFEQISEFKPEAAVIFDKTGYEKLKNSCNGTTILYGLESLSSLIKETGIDLLINALVGFCGLAPTIDAVKSGVTVALANKESLVTAGELIYCLCKKNNSQIIPIDSEHSAIFQCIQGEKFENITKLVLTASGGPFLNTDKSLFDDITPDQALKHPNWKMGSKITIDSATLINKGFEIIEAKWLFNIEADKIQVLIHPQSVIHSLVEFVDGSVKAQLGVPDMRIPIQYAITYPERAPSDFPRLELDLIKKLEFFEPDTDKFECLKLSIDVINSGGMYPVVLNASNEIAVQLFLESKIKFTDIPYLISSAIGAYSGTNEVTIENIYEADKWTRNYTLDKSLTQITA